MSKFIFATNAEMRLESLGYNSYSGKIIITGLSEDGKAILQVYAIMGRSENSRNQVFIYEKTGKVKTEPADTFKVEDPSLSMYTVMLSEKNCHAVSNGHQTAHAHMCGQGHYGLADPEFMSKWKYEPHKLDFTSRITSVCNTVGTNPTIEMSIIKKSPRSEDVVYAYYQYKLSGIDQGFGYALSTFNEGTPFPLFAGESPYLLPLYGKELKDIAETIWEALNEDNRISLAIKSIDLETKEITIYVINKYPKIQ